MAVWRPADAPMDDPIDLALADYLELALAGKALDPAEFVAARAELDESQRARLARALGAAAGRADAHELPRERIGPYRLLRRLGEGGMGVVYLARDERLRRIVALKILRPERLASARAQERFRREAVAVARLRHPSMVTLYDAGEEAGLSFLAMEWIDGDGLDERIARARADGAPLEVASVLRWILEIARALAAAHREGIVHRDVKPSNIRIDRDGRARLLDFGLAKTEDEESLSLTGAFRGSPSYASPEQISGRFGEVDGQSDVYSLGVTLYECVSLRLPHSADTTDRLMHQIISAEPPALRSLRAELPADVEAVVEKAMAKEKSDRYRNMEELALDLAALEQGRPVRARPLSAGARAWRWARRNPAAAAALFFAALALVVAPSALAWREHSSKLQIAAEQQRTEEKAAALDRSLQAVGRLSDSRLLDECLAAAEELWPIEPALVARAADWLGRADALLTRKEIHKKTLDLWERAASSPASPPGGSEGDSWQRSVLAELLRKVDSLEAARSSVVARAEAASHIEERSLRSEPARSAWAKARAAIAADPRYGGLDLAPQLGLLPLGADPRSGFYEFLHVLSGDAPQRLDSGAWQVTAQTGVILVLVPGGIAQTGSRRAARGMPPSGPFVDNARERDEWDRAEHALDAYFLSKYELTQSQWVRIAGDNPSHSKPGSFGITEIHPVEHLSEPLAERMLARVGLTIPTEMQWEFACRAGSSTPFGTGESAASLQGFANILDRSAKRLGGPENWAYTLEVDDGHIRHAPVGSFQPNGWGFYDIHGNLREWCRDRVNVPRLAGAPRAGDGLREMEGGDTTASRGGSFKNPAVQCRVTDRSIARLGEVGEEVGVRAARPVNR